ncbi:MAG: PilZ domain-containing protein [Phycisphaerales bacterium]
MNPLPKPARDPNARRHGRVRAQTITCSLGDVMDISISGMKVRCGSKPDLKKGETAPVTINGLNGPFTVQAKFNWCKRAGLFKWVAGFEFAELTGPARTELLEIARIAAIGETLRPADEHIFRPH